MRVLIFSDSHGRCEPMREVWERQCRPVDMILHLGDCAEDARWLRDYVFPVPVLGVAGNNDFFCDEPQERLLELEGKKIFLTHGHRYAVKAGLYTLLCAARERGADAALFGHTHTALQCTEQGVAFLNPGSVSLPWPGERACFGVLEITGGALHLNVAAV